jgi:7-keto-8-aminopelargonate synthetase-like enzyme
MSKHNSFLDTVDEVFKGAMQNGVWQLSSDTNYIEKLDKIDGRLMKLKTYDQPLINFGNCSYLGLETDKRLQDGAIAAILKHGTQVSSSRAYLSSGLYDSLEEKFEKLFGGSVVIAPTTTLGHLSSLPTLLADDDAVILDQFVHASVQRAVTTEKGRGIKIDILRHNRLDKLEEQIKILRQKHRRIWYMIDGVYSMYGQLAPVTQLYQMLNHYDQFHFYVDDAHGMGWAGKHGRGYTLSQVELHPKMVLATSLAKAFGTTGGVLVFPDKKMAEKVRTVGYTLIFSGPLVPPVLGASLASADIMLSDELRPMQKELMDRIDYGNQLIIEKKLPYVELSRSPIFFICLGHPRVGYNISRRLMLDGFYTNLAIFPAVPVKNTGLRLTFTLHTTKADIQNLMDAVEYHLPRALADEGRTMEDVHKAFKIDGSDAARNVQLPPNAHKPISSNLTLSVADSIHEIQREDWDRFFGGKGSFDWEGLALFESTFRENPERENNWKIRYYRISDAHGKLILATFFTLALTKEDMLAAARISQAVEELRKNDPYYLCSLYYSMGTPLTEGEHLYLDREHPQWKEALLVLLERAGRDRQDLGAKALILRDFAKSDTELKDLFIREGFFPYDMPDNHVLDISQWQTPEEYYAGLSKNSRRHIRLNVFDHFGDFDIELWQSPTREQLHTLYRLYRGLKKNKTELNTFDLPFSLFEAIAKSSSWDILIVRLRPENGATAYENVAAFCFNYVNGKTYCPMLVGTDYELLQKYEPYRQIMYRNIRRAKELGCESVLLAFTASVEKQRFGAVPVPTVMFADAEDNFAMSKMSIM